MDAYFIDSCCVKANIHFPADWVLLRDATRTLMKAVRLTRDQGLKHRMEEPEVFLRQMNRRCIEMAQARTKFQSQRQINTPLFPAEKPLASCPCGWTL